MNCVCLAVVSALCLTVGAVSPNRRPAGRKTRHVSEFAPPAFSHFPSHVSAIPSPISTFPSPISGFPSPISGFPSPISGFPSATSSFASAISAIPSVATGCDVTACIAPLEELERKANISLKFVATDPAWKTDICSTLEVAKTCVERLMSTCPTSITKVTWLVQILNMGASSICSSDVLMTAMDCWTLPEIDMIHDTCLAVYPTLDPCSARKEFRNCIVNQVKNICSPIAANIADTFLVSTLAPAAWIKFPGCHIVSVRQGAFAASSWDLPSRRFNPHPRYAADSARADWRFPSHESKYESGIPRPVSGIASPFSGVPSHISAIPSAISGIPSSAMFGIPSAISTIPSAFSAIPSVATGCDVTACIAPLEELEKKANISLKLVATDPAWKTDICSTLEIAKACVESKMSTCTTSNAKITWLLQILNMGVRRICYSDAFQTTIDCWARPEIKKVHANCLAVYATLDPCSARKEFQNCIVNQVKSICSPMAAKIADIFLVATLAPAAWVKFPGCKIDSVEYSAFAIGLLDMPSRTFNRYHRNLSGCDMTACISPLEELERMSNISLKLVATIPALKTDVCSKLEMAKTCVEGLKSTCPTANGKVTWLMQILNMGVNRICKVNVFQTEVDCWARAEIEKVHDTCLPVYATQDPCSARKQFRKCIVNKVKSVCSPKAATIADTFLVSTMAPAAWVKYSDCKMESPMTISAMGDNTMPQHLKTDIY